MQFQNLVLFEIRDTQLSFFLSPQNETLKLFHLEKSMQCAICGMQYAVCVQGLP